MLTKFYIDKFASNIAAPAANKDPPLVTGHEEKYVYDPEKPLERDLIVGLTEEQLRAIALDKRLQLKKWRYFVCCTVCTLVAIMLTLWGMAQTVIFDSYRKNMLLIWIAIPLYVPILIWLRVLLCPGASEYSLRQYVMEKRFWRQKVTKTRRKIYLGLDKEEEEEQHQIEEDAKAREQRELQRREDIALKMKIGKNVPKLGKLDKTTYQHYRHLPSGGLNVVLDRRGQVLVKPPEILPTQVVETGTAHKLPNYEKNRYDRYKFQHPDPEGEEYGFEVRKLVVGSSEQKETSMDVTKSPTLKGARKKSYSQNKKDPDRSVKFQVV